MPYGQPAGSVSISASGFILTGGTGPTKQLGLTIPVGNIPPAGDRIFNIHLIASATSVLKVTNGNGGTTFLQVTGPSNSGTTFDFGVNGHFFPNGAFAVVDGNISSATISIRSEYA